MDYSEILIGVHLVTKQFFMRQMLSLLRCTYCGLQPVNWVLHFSSWETEHSASVQLRNAKFSVKLSMTHADFIFIWFTKFV